METKQPLVTILLRPLQGNNMTKTKQSGRGNQASYGSNSPNTTLNTNINFKAKAGYFFSGLVLPVIAGLILEFIKTGKTSELLAKILPF